MVSPARVIARWTQLRYGGGLVGIWLRYGGNVDTLSDISGDFRTHAVARDLSVVRFDHARSVAQRGVTRPVQQNGIAQRNAAEG